MQAHLDHAFATPRGEHGAAVVGHGEAHGLAEAEREALREPEGRWIRRIRRRLTPPTERIVLLGGVDEATRETGELFDAALRGVLAREPRGERVFG